MNVKPRKNMNNECENCGSPNCECPHDFYCENNKILKARKRATFEYFAADTSDFTIIHDANREPTQGKWKAERGEELYDFLIRILHKIKTLSGSEEDFLEHINFLDVYKVFKYQDSDNIFSDGDEGDGPRLIKKFAVKIM